MEMIKLIIFDMDGVLVDARDLHYDALNRALAKIGEEYVISKEEHLSTYDGISTTKKLNLLTENKNLPKESHDEVWKLKQDFTHKIVSEEFTWDERIRGILRRFKSEGYTIAVASNSIRKSVKMMLLRKGFLEYIDFYYSNQDVANPKPATEMYLKCMIKANVDPLDTVIVEDSHIGRKGALKSGGNLCGVRDPDDVSYEIIRGVIDKCDDRLKIKPKWQGGNMNVLIPMAGKGSRFAKEGFTFPKPLIEVNGKPMIEVVVDNINIEANHIFIVQKEHYEKYNLEETLSRVYENCKIVQIDEMTDGAACTTLLAREFIDNDEPLLIANSDQFVEWDSNEFMYSMVGDNTDGGILTFPSKHPKWSYAKLDEDGYVTRVEEKKPISDKATVGIYYWTKGSDYVKYADKMIEEDKKVNGEFYVCPVYNEAIEDDKKIKIFDIPRMWGLGTPEDLDYFLKYYGRDRDADVPNPNE
jgi:HAD superfamily hydrolase (TIGR01509 family)